MAPNSCQYISFSDILGGHRLLLRLNIEFLRGSPLDSKVSGLCWWESGIFRTKEIVFRGQKIWSGYSGLASEGTGAAEELMLSV